MHVRRRKEKRGRKTDDMDVHVQVLVQTKRDTRIAVVACSQKRFIIYKEHYHHYMHMYTLSILTRIEQAI